MKAKLDEKAVFGALRSCRLWRAATDDHVRKLAEQATVRGAARGDTLAVEGDPADEYGVLIQGKARVYHLSATGRKMTFEDLGPGDPLGAVAALGGGRFPAHIEAVTAVVVAWLPADSLFHLIADDCAVARSLVRSLAARVVHFTSFVATLSLDVPQRLAGYIFQQALASGRPLPEGLEVDIGMSKSDLAAALGTVPETLSRAFAKLRTAGLVEVHGRKVVVRDVGGLARYGSAYEEG